MAFELLEVAASRTQLLVDGEVVRHNAQVFSDQARNPIYRKLHCDPRWSLYPEKYGVSEAQLADVDFALELPAR